MIDLSKCLWVLLTWPDNSVPLELALWWQRLGVEAKNVVGYCEQGQHDIVRNRVYEKIIRPRLDQYEWIIFCDNDTRPVGATDRFLEEREADAVGCHYETGNPAAMGDPEAFHMGLVRVRTAALQKLDELRDTDKQPHWAFGRQEDNCGLTICECMWFASRLKQSGAKIVRAGWFQHSK
jgi:gamma-glutamylcyclotransferase (GGCT)/AIG2-like uncharacterized protein YtfP